MKMMKTFLPIVIIAVLISGCAGKPTLQESKWTKLEAEFYVPHDNPKALKQTWSTTNQDDLEQLQAAFRMSKCAGMTLLLKTPENKLTVTLANGQKWQIHFLTSFKGPHVRTRWVGLFDPSAPKRSYSVDLADASFHDLLSLLIKQPDGADINFFTDVTGMEIKY